MARAELDKVYTSVVGGINTESSAVAFPEGFVQEEVNLIPTRKGTHERRLGVDYEDDYVIGAETSDVDIYTAGAVNSYVWKNPASSGLADLVVVQEGNLLKFYAHNTSVISARYFEDTINLDDFLVAGSNSTKFYDCDFADGFGVLYVSNRAMYPISISIPPNLAALVPKPITIEIRDFNGVNDGLSVDTRPSTLSTDHRYNLENQGWSISRINNFYSQRTVYPSNADIMYLGNYVDVSTGLEAWSAAGIVSKSFDIARAPRGRKIIRPLDNLTEAPTSATTTIAISSIVRASSGLTTVTLASNPFSVGDLVSFSGTTAYSDVKVGVQEVKIEAEPTIPNFWFKTYTTTTVPVYKRFFYEPLDNRVFTITSVSGNDIVINVPMATSETVKFNPSGSAHVLTESVFDTTTVNTSVSTVEFAHGRLWYSGLNSAEMQGYVFFSQILEDPEQAGKCLQEADPTSEEVPDLVATDGGYITIPEAGNIIKLLAVDRYVIVFGTKGVWSISGQDANFSATEYEVHKISSIRLMGRASVVNAEGTPLFFSDSGIYALVPDEISGRLKAQNVSINSIQSLYTGINYDGRVNSKAVYDPLEKIVYWFYKSNGSTSAYRYAYDSALVFDTTLSAFYTYEIESPSSGYHPFIVDAFPAAYEFSQEIALQVTEDGNDVTEAGNDVTVTIDLSAEGSNGLVLLTAIPSASGVALTMSRFNNSSFVDWYTYDSAGTSFTSRMITGYDTFGDLMKQKQIVSLQVYFDKTETGFDVDYDLIGQSGCNMSIRYAWANSSNTAHIWGPEQVYQFDDVYTPTSLSDTFTAGFPIVSTKVHPRGEGRAVQYVFESVPGKDMKLLGWQVRVSSTTVG